MKLRMSPAMIAYGLRRPPLAPPAKHDRQHREHARRDRRDEPGHEADADQDEHSLVSVESRRLSGNYDASAARAGSGLPGVVSAVSVLAGLRRLRRLFG